MNRWIGCVASTLLLFTLTMRAHAESVQLKGKDVPGLAGKAVFVDYKRSHTPVVGKEVAYICPNNTTLICVEYIGQSYPGDLSEVRGAVIKLSRNDCSVVGFDPLDMQRLQDGRRLTEIAEGQRSVALQRRSIQRDRGKPVEDLETMNSRLRDWNRKLSKSTLELYGKRPDGVSENEYFTNEVSPFDSRYSRYSEKALAELQSFLNGVVPKDASRYQIGDFLVAKEGELFKWRKWIRRDYYDESAVHKGGDFYNLEWQMYSMVEGLRIQLDCPDIRIPGPQGGDPGESGTVRTGK